jgi:hypothetical protein
VDKYVSTQGLSTARKHAVAIHTTRSKSNPVHVLIVQIKAKTITRKNSNLMAKQKHDTVASMESVLSSYHRSNVASKMLDGSSSRA